MFKLNQKECMKKCEWLFWRRGIRTRTERRRFQEAKVRFNIRKHLPISRSYLPVGIIGYLRQ